MKPSNAEALQVRIQAAQAEKARRKLYEFVCQAWPLVDPGMPLRRGWHLEAICDHLEAVSKGHIRKLLINIPPGMGKSLLTAVFWPAWEWVNDPTKQSLFSSYAIELAERDSIRCRDLMTQEWYRDNFVRGAWDFNPSQNRISSFKNTMNGARQCVAVGSKATGFRANKVVVDDPLNVKEAFSKPARDEAIYWWSKVMPTRVNDPARDAFVIIMQRIHEEDLSGYVLEGGDYEHLCLPTEFEGDRRCVTYIRKPTEDGSPPEPVKFFEDPRTQEGELLFPALFTRKVVDDLKKPITGLGEDGFAGQHQQRPTSAEGGMFKLASWRFWTHAPGVRVGTAPRPKGASSEPAKVAPLKFHYTIGSIDASFKDTVTSDYVVASVWGVVGVERYLLDLVRARLSFTATCEMLAGCPAPFLCGCLKCEQSLVKKWPRVTRWLVEDKANGTAIINSLKGRVRGLLPIQPEGGKEARAAAAQPYVEAGQVYLPDGAVWAEPFVTECASFPRGKHDDQVDSMSQALVYLENPDVSRLVAAVNASQH